MAQCTYCGADTQLYTHGVPVCVACCDDLEAGRKPPSQERGSSAKNQQQAN